MNKIFIFIFIVIIIDIYYRFRLQTKLNALTMHSAILVNFYEKILLNKKIITSNDIKVARDLIKKSMSDKSYEKTKRMVLSIDRDYEAVLHELIYNGIIEDKEKFKAKKWLIEEALYNKNYQELEKELSEISGNFEK
jgi:hypothetical protein